MLSAQNKENRGAITNGSSTQTNARSSAALWGNNNGTNKGIKGNNGIVPVAVCRWLRRRGITEMKKTEITARASGIEITDQEKA